MQPVGLLVCHRQDHHLLAMTLSRLLLQMLHMQTLVLVRGMLQLPWSG